MPVPAPVTEAAPKPEPAPEPEPPAASEPEQMVMSEPTPEPTPEPHLSPHRSLPPKIGRLRPSPPALRGGPLHLVEVRQALEVPEALLDLRLGQPQQPV